MDDKHNKLDDFLRDQLHDSSEDHTWNVPDDRVFDNAMQAIRSGKKKKRRGWIILPLLFIAVLIGIEYIHLGQVESLEHKIASLEDSLSTHAHNEAAHLALAATEENNTISSGKNTNDISSSKTSTIDAEQAAAISMTAKEKNNTLSSGKNTNDISSPKTPNIDAEEAAAISISSGNKKKQKASTESKGDVTTPPTEFSDNQINRSEEQNQALAIASAISKVDEDGVDENEAVPANSNTDESSYWTSSFLAPLSIKGLSVPIPEINIALSTPSIPDAAPTKSMLPWQYGLLFGANQSWLTMKNIPDAENTKLYEYDNHQSGAGVSVFVEKPLSRKLSIQTGLGYQYYQNQSVLEDQFLFESSNVVQMPDGAVYQTAVDVTNPLGDYNAMLEFRVTDQMEDDDVISEYTSMKQDLHTVNLDLSVGYKVLTVGNFDLSIGAGLSVGYLAGLKNDFALSCYHNGMLQSSQLLAPEQLKDSQEWYGQALGNLSMSYKLSSHFRVLLQSQYRAGITSMRRGTEANGSQTYLHALSLSAGVGYSF